MGFLAFVAMHTGVIAEAEEIARLDDPRAEFQFTDLADVPGAMVGRRTSHRGGGHACDEFVGKWVVRSNGVLRGTFPLSPV